MTAPEPVAREDAGIPAWKALKKYGRHNRLCDAASDDERRCICGYHEALSDALSANATGNALVARLREAEERDRSFRCSYCGYSISRCADREEVETIMRAHTEECDKHPMARLRAQLAAAVEHEDAVLGSKRT